MSSPDNIAFSGDGRFNILYWDAGGLPAAHIRLRHAPTGTTVLDLTDDALLVEHWAFSGDGKILYLTLTRADRSIVKLPANIDLNTGLFYHHPVPASGHPVGYAAHLPLLARQDSLPPYDPDPKAPTHWLAPEDLDWKGGRPGDHLKNAPAPPVPAPVAPAPAARNASGDGQWRIELLDHELVPLLWVESLQITHMPTRSVVVDLRGGPWDCEAAFIDHVNQVMVTLKNPLGSDSIRVKIDLDCMLYWEEEGLPRGARVQAGPLSEFQARYGGSEPTSPIEPRSSDPQPATSDTVRLALGGADSARLSTDALERLGSLVALACRSGVPPAQVQALTVAAAVAAGGLTPEQAIAALRQQGA